MQFDSEVSLTGFAPETQFNEDEVGFIQAARRQARWAQPWVRAALALGIVLSLVLLSFQVALHERDQLAAKVPALQPTLTTACEWIGCEVHAFREPDAVVIDATKFVKLGADVQSESFQLEMTLKNKTAYAVALPALELTLTNNQDLTVARKVFQPEEFAAGVVMPAASEKIALLSVQVMTQALGSRISGYRVTLFYP